MEFKKNQKIDLNIIDLTKDGLGIAKISSRVFFVKDAIVGDKVNAVITKITDNVIYAKAREIIKKSEYRIDSKCKVSNSCGGCQLLNLDYEKQLEIKKKNVFTTLNKIGKIDINYIDKCYDGILSMGVPHRFRNKMQVPFAMRDGKVIYGFYAGRTHHIIEFDYCITGFKNSEEILDIIRDAIVKFNISVYDENTNQGVFREVLLRCGNVSNEISITYIINDKNYEKNLDLYKTFDKYIVDEFNKTKHIKSHESVGAFTASHSCANSCKLVTSTININTSNTNVLFGNKDIILRGTGYIEDNIGDIKFHISPESFYQVNREMTKVLYDKVIEYADFKGKENVLDLYCGIGTISLYISKYVKSVLGVEIVERAIENAKENAKINNITNAKFICESVDSLSEPATRRGERCEPAYKYDIVIVDPPRKGLDRKVIDYIKSFGAKKIIYVSCDPATLARDINIFLNSEVKYSLEKISNVDMFPHTMHIETVVLMTKSH